jgi:hypothetical protein
LILIPQRWGYSIAFYDPKKKLILKYGTSRPCGKNHSQRSIHVEELAINYCRGNDNRNKYQIYIWRYDTKGNVKSAFCCNRCNILVNKYNFNSRIFTFENDNIISSLTDNPKVCLGYKLNEWGFK